jgi:hypothetical protein
MLTSTQNLEIVIQLKFSTQKLTPPQKFYWGAEGRLFNVLSSLSEVSSGNSIREAMRFVSSTKFSGIGY